MLFNSPVIRVVLANCMFLVGRFLTEQRKEIHGIPGDQRRIFSTRKYNAAFRHLGRFRFSTGYGKEDDSYLALLSYMYNKCELF